MKCEFETSELMTKVTSEVEKRHGSRAIGMDEVHPEFIKALDFMGLSRLTTLYNTKWTSGAVYLDWQTGVMVPLFEKKDRRVCCNYRGHSSPSLVRCR